MNNFLLQQLRQQAYDRYLSLWLAPPAAQDFLLAFFSLEHELRQLPGKVSNPTLGVMRVTWWRDALAALPHDKGNPVLAALASYADQAALLGDFAETFDAAFYEDDPQPRVNERADFAAVILAKYLPAQLPVIRALWLVIEQGGELPEVDKKDRQALRPLLFLARTVMNPPPSRWRLAARAFFTF